MASEVVDEQAVYLCTGNPLPQDIEQVAQWLFNESFAIVFEGAALPLTPLWCCKVVYESIFIGAGILDMQMEKGLALLDIIQQLHPCVLSGACP